MTFAKPSKEMLQEYLQQRRDSGNPPPTPEEIRRQLGWELIQAEQETNRRKP